MTFGQPYRILTLQIFCVLTLVGLSLGQPLAQQFDASTYYQLAKQLLKNGKFEQASKMFAVCAKRNRDQSESIGQAWCLFNIANIKGSLGDHEAYFEAYNQAMTIMKGAKSEDASSIIIGMRVFHAAVLAKVGERQRSLDEFQELLRLLPNTTFPQAEKQKIRGKIYANVAGIYAIEGHYRMALQYYDKAIDTQRKTDDKLDEAGILLGKALTYETVGNEEMAMETLQGAREHLDAIETDGEFGDFQSLNVWKTRLSIQFYIGAIELKKGRLSEALGIFREMQDLSQRAKSQRGEGMALVLMGQTYFLLGKTDLATRSLEQGMALSKITGNSSAEALALTFLGMLRLESSPARAFDLFTNAQRIAESEDLSLYPLILGDMAYAKTRLGDTSAAIDLLQEAIRFSESMRSELKVDYLSSSFSSRQNDLYAFLIDLLVRSGRESEAFQYSEKSRSRAFLNRIGNRRVNYRRGANPDMMNQERRLNRRLAELRKALSEAQKIILSHNNEEIIRSLGREIREAIRAHKNLVARIKLESPEYASLISVDSLTLLQVQERVLEGNTTLIEYFLLKDRTLAWVIDKDSSHLEELPISQADLHNSVEFFRKSLASKASDMHVASSLYKELFEPLTKYIRNRTVTIIPNDVLHYLPFAALWDKNHSRYLIEEYAINYAPSASILRFLQRKRKRDLGGVLAVGDPDGNLPYAADEARTVVSALKGKPPLIGKKGSETRVRDQSPKVGVLHLAAHGVFEPSMPMYSHIALAGDDTNDGRLEVHEIFDLTLNSANLIVLSACNTGVGRLESGDEITTLTRAFLYAGAPAVISTLWSINSPASAELMRIFYTNLGKSTSVNALQEAQKAISKHRDWHDPHYWAAFTLTGDYIGNR